MQAIVGEGDVVVPLSSGRLLERNAGASLHIMCGLGHTPHLEDPATTWRLIEAFVERAVGANGQRESARAPVRVDGGQP
jgi:pimeloyl-ACP methyl ester carboxylesterase